MPAGLTWGKSSTLADERAAADVRPSATAAEVLRTGNPAAGAPEPEGDGCVGFAAGAASAFAGAVREKGEPAAAAFPSVPVVELRMLAALITWTTWILKERMEQ